MGISGLLPFIKNSCRPANVRDFKGCTVAVDAYSWLHKGAFSCADKIAKGEKTDGYVHYCIKRVNLLIECGVKPIMVFDGCNLESKAGTEKKRHEQREKTRRKGKEHLCQGNLREAQRCFQSCVDVTPEMAHDTIQACKAKNIDCIVAPYEADAQLAYLNRCGIVQVVITEDSDLVVFGCDKILFKMDGCGGGLLYEKEHLPKSFGNKGSKMNFDKFRCMCILSGCDYLPSLHGIGLAKAFKFFSLTNSPDLFGVLSKLPSYLQMDSLQVNAEYVDAFIRAYNTFLHQLVFCPKLKRLVPLNPYPEDIDGSDMDYAGKYVSDDIACQIAMGNINVKTMKEFKDMEWGSSKNWSKRPIISVPNSIWDDGPVQEAKPKTQSAFVTKQRPKSSPVKRQRTNDHQSENVDFHHNDELLFSSYKIKESPKASSENIEKSPPSPFRKSLSVNSANISKSPVRNPFKKVVKSRFFCDAQGSDVKKVETKLNCFAVMDKTSKAKVSILNDRISLSDFQRKEITDLECNSEANSSADDSLIGSSCDTSLTDSLATSSQLSSESSQIPLSDSSGVESLSGSLDSNKSRSLQKDSSPVGAVKRTSSYFDSVGVDSSSLSKAAESSRNSMGGGLGKTFSPVSMNCRTIGLSKNKWPKLEKKLTTKETLFCFNFTRHSKSSPVL